MWSSWFQKRRTAVSTRPLTFQCRPPTSSATKLSAAAWAFAGQPSATFSALRALQCWQSYGKAVAHIHSFIIAAAWGPMSCCGGSKMWSKQSGILLVWIASWFNSAAQVNPARGSLTTWCVSKRSTRRWALRLKTGRFVFNGRHAVLMLIGWLYF